MKCSEVSEIMGIGLGEVSRMKPVNEWNGVGGFGVVGKSVAASDDSVVAKR